jgi:hypothetical protein
MTEPVIRRCPDGHHRKVIYDLAGFIADYPEQVALAGTVSGWCPKSVLSCISLMLKDISSFMTGVQPYREILMDFVVAEHEHSLTSCWTLLIQKRYGTSMELMTTF